MFLLIPSPHLQLTVKARDQRIPEQTGQGFVSLFVTSDRSTPYFVGEPYTVETFSSTNIGTPIFGVQARDDRLTVSGINLRFVFSINSFCDVSNVYSHGYF